MVQIKNSTHTTNWNGFWVVGEMILLLSVVVGDDFISLYGEKFREEEEEYIWKQIFLKIIYKTVHLAKVKSLKGQRFLIFKDFFPVGLKWKLFLIQFFIDVNV